MRAILMIALVAAGVCDTASLGNQALAEEPLCASRQRILAALAEKFQETPVALGIDNGGALLELLTSKDGLTWTLIASGPEGKSCVIAAGEDWQDVVREPSGPSL